MIKQDGLFNVASTNGYDADGTLTKVGLTASLVKLIGNSLQYNLNEASLLMGYTNGSTGNHGLVQTIGKESSGNDIAPSYWILGPHFPKSKV